MAFSLRALALVALLPVVARAASPASPLVPGDFADGTLRYATTRGSGIRSDTFTLPAGGTQLSVHFKFLTSEFNPFDFNAGQNDYAVFGLFDPAQSTITPLGGVEPVTRGVLDPNTGLVPLTPGYTSPRGDAYTFESTGIELDVDVPASLAGHQAYVLFAVFDCGDTLGPSAAIVGGFSQPVPGAYFSPTIDTFLGGSGGVSGYMNMVPTENLPPDVVLDGYTGTLPLLSTGGTPIPEPASLALLALASPLLLRRSQRLKTASSQRS